jgi:hypothetical protein
MQNGWLTVRDAVPRWILPIIECNKRGNPAVCGHGFLLKVESGKKTEYLLVSAAHVFDPLKNGIELFIPGEEGFIRLLGLGRWLSLAPGDDRKNDPIDLAYVTVSPVRSKLSDRSEFASLRDLSSGAPHRPGFHYTVYGCPPKRVKWDPTKRLLEGSWLQYTGDCLDESFHAGRITDSLTNLAIEFDKDHAKTVAEGAHVTPPSLEGLSGTPLLTNGDSIGRWWIIGFLTDHVREKKAVVSTRIEKLIENLEKRHGKLQTGNAKIGRTHK